MTEIWASISSSVTSTSSTVTARESSGGQLEGRGDVDGGGEGQGLAVVEAGDLDLGLADDADLVLAHGLGVDLRDGVLDDLLQDDGAPDPLVEDAGRDLAGAETGNADLLAQLLVDLTKAWSRSLDGTSIASRTRVGPRFSMVLFTARAPLEGGQTMGATSTTSRTPRV